VLLWSGFIICTLVIVYSGTRLSKYGDIIAEKTGLGRAWIGLVLMASVTSLPELVTGISSVTFAGVPDIAVGDVLGSCVFNMLIIAILDAQHRIMPISTKAHQGNILSAAFGILLLSIVAVSIYLGNHISPLGWIGPYSIFFVILYLFAIRLVYFYEKRQIAILLKEKAVELRYENISTKTAVLNYTLNAVIVVIAAAFLPKIGEGIAETTGLGQTFVGNIFIAISTSLPEVVVSLSAIKIDAIDLAIGNLFGSNIFNILILAIDDIFFMKGPLLSFANPNHIISAQSAIIMMTLAVIGLTYRAAKKPLFLAWDSIGIITIYIINIMLLYTLKSP
jgi:cation:H+ antiporter